MPPRKTLSVVRMTIYSAQADMICEKVKGNRKCKKIVEEALVKAFIRGQGS